MADAREARIYVLAGPDVARSFALGERSTLGRSDECDVVLRDRSISRKHAQISRVGDGWVVEDLGSTNGISKDENRAQRIELADGDEFKLGDLPLRVRWSQPAAAQEIEFVDAPLARPGAPAPRSHAEPEVELEPEVEEIEIEGPDSPVAAPRARAGAPAPARFERAARRTGFLSADLEQQPFWMRCLLALLVLALGAGLAYGAYRAVLLVRAGL